MIYIYSDNEGKEGENSWRKICIGRKERRRVNGKKSQSGLVKNDEEREAM